MSARKLSPKQEVFVQEYLKDLNATQAAMNYSIKIMFVKPLKKVGQSGRNGRKSPPTVW